MIEDQKKQLGLTGDIKAMSMVKALVVGTGGASLYCKAFCAREPVWDVAPCELFVREAGGIVTNVDGLPLYFAADGTVDNSERGCLFTSNGPLWHRRACDVIRPYLDKKEKKSIRVVAEPSCAAGGRGLLPRACGTGVCQGRGTEF
jgi:hypothetical protein